jgi:hypothetical protein
MFSYFAQLISRRKALPAGHPEFVLKVTVSEWKKPNRRTEWIMLAAWVLIAIKHVAVIWAVHHYPVPFHQLWINFPTWLLGTLATVIYFRRD